MEKKYKSVKVVLLVRPYKKLSVKEIRNNVAWHADNSTTGVLKVSGKKYRR